MIDILITITVAVITLVCLVIALLVGAGAVVLFIFKVPFAPTPKKNLKIIINELNLKPGEVFYDLGCGDGRFLIAATKRGAKAIGFEISLWAYLRGKINILLNKSKAKIFFSNFYRANISDADAVFCFLIDTVMPKVEAKLKKELKPGARIACYGFKLPTWPPVKIIDLKPLDKRASNIYLYKKF